MSNDYELDELENLSTLLQQSMRAKQQDNVRIALEDANKRILQLQGIIDRTGDVMSNWARRVDQSPMDPLTRQALRTLLEDYINAIKGTK